MKLFEDAVDFYPNHTKATAALAELLIKIYEKEIPPEPLEENPLVDVPPLATKQSPDHEELNRLAARDRAYYLMSTLTKSGAGWDSSEAWAALGNVYKATGEIEKEKVVLWHTVELEDYKPLRKWDVAGLA